MDSDIEHRSVSLEKFTKCAEVYRYSTISEKQYIFLSCIYCKDISWEYDTFLQHLDDVHQSIDNICSTFYKDEELNEENSISDDNVGELKTNQPLANKEKDPLEEKRYDYSELLPVAIKIETAIESAKEHNDVCDPGSNIDSKDNSVTNILLEINELEHDNSSNEDYDPDKITTDDENDENTGDYLNEEYDEYEDDDDDNVDIMYYKNDKDNKKTNLKHFTKNHEFIKAVIKSYEKQSFLWDSAYNTKKRCLQEKQQALEKILNEINEKFKISATLEQIERIIKRLKLRFMHEMRLRDKGDSHKPLWYYDLLKFLEPHYKENKLKSSICKQLDDKQFLTLIRLLKENECFWNENNIYHTSVINKQEILKSMANNFAKLSEFNNVDVDIDIMQNTIEETLEIAREENSNRIKYAANNKLEEYESLNKFCKEMEFLLPHVGPFQCNYCPKTFSDIYAYKFHISKHDGSKPFKCMVCPRELTHKKEFVCHLRRHTKECPFKCDACEKSFPSKKEWHRHVIKHGSKPYVCELCADSFYTQHQLTNHMKNHNNIRDHVCPECGKGFTHRGLLRQHLQTHNKAKCFCPLCDNIYSNPRSLRRHYIRVHESDQPSSVTSMAHYICQICKITFSTIQDAKQHRKEHKQSNPVERRHVCDICGHHFAYPRNLLDHKKTHSNIRDQVCDVCGKAFTNANLLNQHKNVHTGEKFVCKACGKDYAHYRGLCRHITKVHGINIRDLDAWLEKQKLTPSQ